LAIEAACSALLMPKPITKHDSEWSHITRSSHPHNVFPYDMF
jgi:hypothetical protein